MQMAFGYNHGEDQTQTSTMMPGDWKCTQGNSCETGKQYSPSFQPWQDNSWCDWEISREIERLQKHAITTAHDIYYEMQSLSPLDNSVVVTTKQVPSCRCKQNSLVESLFLKRTAPNLPFILLHVLWVLGSSLIIPWKSNSSKQLSSNQKNTKDASFHFSSEGENLSFPMLSLLTFSLQLKDDRDNAGPQHNQHAQISGRGWLDRAMHGVENCPVVVNQRLTLND